MRHFTLASYCTGSQSPGHGNFAGIILAVLVTPLHKKGPVDSADNYRGIALLSVVGKLFTRILNNRLSGWAEDENFWYPGQAGFRPGHSTVDNAFILHRRETFSK